MFNLTQLVRKNILSLRPYSSARSEFTGKEGIFLDANENPFGQYNRYPDPYQKKLKSRLGELKNIPSENIFIGNGSDEVIDLIFRIFCQPQVDKALTFSPTYGMYQVVADIHETPLTQIPLDENFQIDLEAFQQTIEKENFKLLLICSPNNPTGNILKGIDKVLEMFKGIVLIDEAYIDFSESSSWASKVQEYPNLIVSQTLSKAWGLAAARVGVAYTNPDIIALLNKVKPPYNVSQLNQEIALQTLANPQIFEEQKATILAQKKYLEKELNQLSIIQKIYPSDANFLLVETAEPTALYNRLIGQNIIIRNRSKLVENALRITVGTPEENQLLITQLKKISNEKSPIYR